MAQQQWVQASELVTDDDGAWFAGDPSTLVDLVDAAALLGVLMRRPTWHARAACKGENLSTFFPPRGASLKLARTLCQTCPVRRDCQATGVNDERLQGVWGGLTANERRTVRRGVA